MNEPENKDYMLVLSQDQATMLWWALWEKETQMRSRIQEFQHLNWPSECRNASVWEADVLRVVREKLESLRK